MIVTDVVIAKVSGLPAVGPIWTHKKLRLQDAIMAFGDEGHNLIIKGKGVQPSSLGEQWIELARIVQRYITCDGRKDVVRLHHLKLLVVLNHKFFVNLPAYLKFLLHDAAQSIKKSRI